MAADVLDQRAPREHRRAAQRFSASISLSLSGSRRPQSHQSIGRVRATGCRGALGVKQRAATANCQDGDEGQQQAADARGHGVHFARVGVDVNRTTSGGVSSMDDRRSVARRASPPAIGLAAAGLREGKMAQHPRSRTV